MKWEIVQTRIGSADRLIDVESETDSQTDVVKQAHTIFRFAQRFRLSIGVAINILATTIIPIKLSKMVKRTDINIFISDKR